MRRLSLLAALVVLAAGCSDDDTVPIHADADPFRPDATITPDAAPLACDPASGTSIATQEVATGIQNPVAIASLPGDPRLFVIEQAGRIRLIKDGVVQSDPFLDVSDRVSCCGERGLLGLAFHPDHAQNRRFFIYYTDPDGDMVIAESETDFFNADRAGDAAPTIVLEVPHPDTGNHNGGWVGFGPDGYLYAGFGDGGGGGDPFQTGQDLTELRAKIIRIDVDMANPYAIPTDNPFAGMGGGIREEIWAYGVRNPWRNSFDRETGDFYIGDVGQNDFEEIDVQPAASTGGENYGWSIMEGNSCYNAGSCDMTGLVLPVYEYPHDGSGASVSGGYVYRGCNLPDLAGTYFFADYNDGFTRSFRWDGAGGITALTDYPDLDGLVVTAFGEDGNGELLLTDYGSGRILKLVAGP